MKRSPHTWLVKGWKWVEGRKRPWDEDPDFTTKARGGSLSSMKVHSAPSQGWASYTVYHIGRPLVISSSWRSAWIFWSSDSSLSSSFSHLDCGCVIVAFYQGMDGPGTLFCGSSLLSSLLTYPLCEQTKKRTVRRILLLSSLTLDRLLGFWSVQLA